MANEYKFYRITEGQHQGKVGAIFPNGSKRTYLSPMHALDFAKQIASNARISIDDKLNQMPVNGSQKKGFVGTELRKIIHDYALRENSSERELVGTRD
ncbi:MAG: hypothetical protein AABW88_02210 [Nanoarchaeota archaeon]